MQKEIFQLKVCKTAYCLEYFKNNDDIEHRLN